MLENPPSAIPTPALLKMIGPLFLIVSAVVAAMYSPDGISAKGLVAANARLRSRHRELRKMFQKMVLPTARETISKMESLQKERLMSFCALRKCAQILEHARLGNPEELGHSCEGGEPLKEWMDFGGEAEAVLDKIANGFSVAAALAGGAFAIHAGCGIALPYPVAASRGSADTSPDDEDQCGRARFTLPGLLASPVITFAAVPVKCRDEVSEAAAASTLARMESQESRLRREREAIQDIGLRADELREATEALREKLLILIREAGAQPQGIAASSAELYNLLKIPLTTMR